MMKIRPRGFELNSATNETGDSYEIGGDCVGTESGTDREFCGSERLISDPCDSDLQQVIVAWARLPETVRRGILAMVHSVKTDPEEIT